MKIREELMCVDEDFLLQKIFNEAAEMDVADIAKELKTSQQYVYQTLQSGMTKMYTALKTAFKMSPFQAVLSLAAYLKQDPADILGYLNKAAAEEVKKWTIEHKDEL
jgi:hypothetical protein